MDVLDTARHGAQTPLHTAPNNTAHKQVMKTQVLTVYNKQVYTLGTTGNQATIWRESR